MRLVLPDCTDVADPFYLEPELRRELLLLIAEKGEAGIDEFLRRHAADRTLVARHIERLRAKLLEEGAELRRRLHSQYDEAREQERARSRAILDRLHHEEADLRRRDEALRGRLPHDLDRAIRGSPLIDIALKPAPRLSFFVRVWNAVRTFVSTLWHGLLRLLGLRRGPKGVAKALAIGVPGLDGPAIQVDMDLAAALRHNPRLRRAVRERMSVRHMWRILLGLDDYAQVAQRLMEQEALEAARSRSQEVLQSRAELDAGVTRRQADESRALELSKAELARLDQAEALERERLEATLAARPAQDVRRLVVDELEAGGLLTKIEGHTQVTARFLESLAAIVYAEESRGMGGGYEAPIGSTIEGEGALERTPLLSHDETSHMDTATSLLNARTRHPHVRHLLEEDVVVYRERRTSATHVVLILDKSLSMAENDRMMAGKRAVLALYWGTKKRSPQNRVDVLLMDTSVVRANLGQAWEAKPGGFTNTGRAIEAARALLRDSRATRKLLFLVTDGLPEAVTVEGKDVAARPEEALAYALRQAERLRDVKGLSTTLVLLEAEDPLFVKAAEKLAARCRGKVVRVAAKELARSLLVELRDQALVARATA